MIGHLKNLNETLSIETKIFTNLMERWQQMANPLLSPGLNTIDESYSSRENNFGAELMLRETLFARHRLLAGCQFVQTEIDPVIYSAKHPAPGASGSSEYRLLAAPDEKDQTIALYIEDDWRLLNQLHLIFGLRMDHNELREDGTKLLPRFSAILGMTPRWTAKYMFNTGYVRPPVGKSFLGQQPLVDTFFYGPLPSQGVEESEEVFSHDLQLIYNQKKLESTLTAYHTTFDNAFNFYGRETNTESGLIVPLYVNSSEITSYGIEFDFRHNLGSLFDWYGNYSWIIFAEMDTLSGTTATGIPYSWLNSYLVTDGKALTQFPHHSWNIGVNFLLHEAIRKLPHSSLNIHYRGWTDMWAENPDAPGTHLMLGPEHFVDLNLLFKNIAAVKLDLALYAKNVLDNDDSRYQLPMAGFWSVRGRSIGLRASYTF
ncbi:MAG: TonB-dependent receptor plug domain-containing protein [Thermodesulfobacteriota bacterium]